MNAIETEQNAQCPALLDPQEMPSPNRFYDSFKRAQDVVLSVLALAVLWPLMLLVALVIVIDSPGASPIFAQKRVGRNGKEFTFYKFRSMCPDAEAKLEKLLMVQAMDVSDEVEHRAGHMMKARYDIQRKRKNVSLLTTRGSACCPMARDSWHWAGAPGSCSREG